MRELEVVELAAADGLAGPSPAPPALRGDGPKHAVLHVECLNCGTGLHGRYCSACGQVADDHHRSILHLLWEAVEGLTHLDGRLARTIPPLFFNPGRLARDHFEGRRQRHVPPFRLFLVTLLLFMLALEASMHAGRQGPAHAGAPKFRNGVMTVQGKDGETTRVVLPTAAQVARWSKGGVSDAEIEAELKGEAAPGGPPTPSPAPSPKPGAAPAGTGGATPAATRGVHVGVRPLDASKGPVTLNVNAGPGAADAKDGDDGPAEKLFNGWLHERIGKAQANPEYYKSLVFEWAHRLAILLLPIFAAQLTLLYVYRRQFYVYDHLVVSMQFLSFVFLISAAAWVLPKVVRDWAVPIASLWTPVNLFMLLRGAYGSGIVGALLKTFFLWVSTLVVFSVALVGLLALGLQQL